MDVDALGAAADSVALSAGINTREVERAPVQEAGGEEGGCNGVLNEVVVLDPGHWKMKCGFAGASLPTTFMSVVGRPFSGSNEGEEDDLESRQFVVGDEAYKRRHRLTISYLGSWADSEDMPLLWDHAFFNMLDIDPREKKLLLSLNALFPNAQKEKWIEVLMEKYGFKGIQLPSAAVLAMYAQGLLTGVSVDIGWRRMNIVPVYEGYPLHNHTKRLDIGGSNISMLLHKQLLLAGHSFNRSGDLETLNLMKEKLCFVSADFNEDMRLAAETTSLVTEYKLPDGRKIKVNKERFIPPECLFTPSLCDISASGLSMLLFDCISRVDAEINRELSRHVVLCGGSTLLPGLATRIEGEMKELQSMRRVNIGPVRIEDPVRRQFLVFQGGSILGKIMNDKDAFWINQGDYSEQGVHGVIAKCVA